ncbi:hypothetical protein O181_022854 [Austropuccinia psidii MF-1]|uniref:Uncharacterized protein n=1 Tax=Austropuccinia psidii MF-1 TaxID=1389203 RepID=A0A9Q3CFL0_9BASI|nr:hypothetical protein [Austropuccinia psidii MF-1]
MENKIFNLTSHWEELWKGLWKIFLGEISFKDLMEITKGWNTNKQFKVFEEREAKIRWNQATTQPKKQPWSQKENIPTPSGSQGVDQATSPVALHNPESSKLVAKRISDHYYNNFSKEKKKFYAIEQVPEEAIEENSESEPMGDAIRESSYDEKDPI